MKIKESTKIQNMAERERSVVLAICPKKLAEVIRMWSKDKFITAKTDLRTTVPTIVQLHDGRRVTLMANVYDELWLEYWLDFQSSAIKDKYEMKVSKGVA